MDNIVEDFKKAVKTLPRAQKIFPNARIGLGWKGTFPGRIWIEVKYWTYQIIKTKIKNIDGVPVKIIREKSPYNLSDVYMSPEVLEDMLNWEVK